MYAPSRFRTFSCRNYFAPFVNVIAPHIAGVKVVGDLESLGSRHPNPFRKREIGGMKGIDKDGNLRHFR